MNRVVVLFLCLGIFPLAADPSDVLRVNFGASAIQTDPAKGQTALEAQVLTALYEGLVVYDPLSPSARTGRRGIVEFLGRRADPDFHAAFRSDVRRWNPADRDGLS